MRKDQCTNLTTILLCLLLWKCKGSVLLHSAKRGVKDSSPWELQHPGVANLIGKCSKETAFGTNRFGSWKAESPFACLLAIHNLYRILNAKYLLIITGLPAGYSVNKHIWMQTVGTEFPRVASGRLLLATGAHSLVLCRNVTWKGIIKGKFGFSHCHRGLKAQMVLPQKKCDFCCTSLKAQSLSGQ